MIFQVIGYIDFHISAECVENIEIDIRWQRIACAFISADSRHAGMCRLL